MQPRPPARSPPHFASEATHTTTLRPARLGPGARSSSVTREGSRPTKGRTHVNDKSACEYAAPVCVYAVRIGTSGRKDPSRTALWKSDGGPCTERGWRGRQVMLFCPQDTTCSVFISVPLRLNTRFSTYSVSSSHISLLGVLFTLKIIISLILILLNIITSLAYTSSFSGGKIPHTEKK